MDALLIILGLIWLGYSALFAGIIFLGWLIGRISRNQLLVKLFYVLMALIATFDIPYGVFTYSAKMHSWPEYVINKTIYTIARHDEYSVFTSMENDFDINQFLKLATECYKSEKNSCTEAALKEIKVEQSQLNSKGFKQYTYVYYRKR